MCYHNKYTAAVEAIKKDKHRQEASKQKQHELELRQKQADWNVDKDRFKSQEENQKKYEDTYKEDEAKHKEAAKKHAEYCHFIVFAVGVAIFRQLAIRLVDCAALTDHAQVPDIVSYGNGRPAASTYLEGNLLGGTVMLGRPTQKKREKGRTYNGVMLIHRLTLSKMYR